MRRADLQAYLDQLLEACRFKDYCPNGLQVEGRDEIRRLVAGVTASRPLIEAAAGCDADAILVHHGWFWRGEDARVTGIRKARLAALLSRDLSLFAYHLPLDAHPEYGNNAQLARLMGWRPAGRCGEQDLVWLGECAATTAGGLASHVSVLLGREPLLVGDPARPVRRLGWCSGAAQNRFEEAIAAGVDCYVSGEISEPTVHLARESDVAYLAAGHHATERYGVQALAEHLVDRFGLECRFIDIDNPA